jgi:hypothetical protein
MNQDTLQHQLWEFANDLRGKVPANEYLKKWLLDTDDHRARWKRLDAWLRSGLEGRGIAISVTML